MACGKTAGAAGCRFDTSQLSGQLEGMKHGATISMGTFEAKNKLSALVEVASKGGRVWITKRGRRVALLSAGDERAGLTGGDLVEAFRRVRSSCKGAGAPLKSLIEEGRR